MAKMQTSFSGCRCCAAQLVPPSGSEWPENYKLSGVLSKYLPLGILFSACVVKINEISDLHEPMTSPLASAALCASAN